MNRCKGPCTNLLEESVIIDDRVSSLVSGKGDTLGLYRRRYREKWGVSE
jgi:hypothetical protein